MGEVEKKRPIIAGKEKGEEIKSCKCNYCFLTFLKIVCREKKLFL